MNDKKYELMFLKQKLNTIQTISLYYNIIKGNTNKSKRKGDYDSMAKSKLVAANKKIEEGVVGGYKKIEEGVVGGFNKMSDKFVDNYLTKDGESVEEAKERLAAEQRVREEESKKEMEERKQRQQEIIEESKRRAESHRH